MSTDWDAIWDRKGNSASTDRVEVSGFEKYTDNDYANVSEKLKSLINLQPGQSVLEVGCSAGLIAQHINHLCTYVGVDRSASIVKKTIELNKNISTSL